MSQSSNIEWTNSTWNPVTGCSKISPGCHNCYAERMARRLKAMKQPNYINGFEVTLHNNSLYLPIKWKTPQTIFVNSMSDLFHENVPIEFILKVFDIMNTANWHTYQLLTKRSDRLLELDAKLPWAPHIWMGVSIENDMYKRRLDDLRRINANMKFISFEPLLGPITDLNLKGINWAIVGGESGPNARPIQPSWITDIRNICNNQEIPFFFKQWGGVRKKKFGRLLEGRTWDEMPKIA